LPRNHIGNGVVRRGGSRVVGEKSSAAGDSVAAHSNDGRAG